MNKRTNLITSKPLFTITVIIAVITILAIWLFGLGQGRTLFENSILSTTILSVAFFLFITIGLYKGIKLKDNVGKVTDKIKFPQDISLPDTSAISLEGDGIAGIILAIFFWIFAAILIVLFLWMFGAFLWFAILGFIAMLYWIFFRALRLVFKNSYKCKGKLAISTAYGFAYTVLYNFWIYIIIFLTHYFS
jgi:hypothetical protein